MTTLEQVAILLKVRSMSENDPNLLKMWSKRKEMITLDPLTQKTLLDYPTYPDSADQDVKDFCATVNAQLTLYKGKKGIFARAWVMESARDMPAHLWWDQNGGSVPELQVLPPPCPSSRAVKAFNAGRGGIVLG